MSIYEGTITMRVRFAADNGDTADFVLKAIGGEIQSNWHGGLPRDSDGKIDEEATFEQAGSLIVGYEAKLPAERA